MKRNLNKINIHYIGVVWRVWLPRDPFGLAEEMDIDAPQLGWGDFYFDTFHEAFIFTNMSLFNARKNVSS